MTRIRTAQVGIAAAALALVLAACASPTPAPSPEPSASSTPSASASPSPSDEPSASAVPFEPPTDVPGGLARADFSIVDGVPTNASTALGPLASGQSFTIEGQCVGGESVDFLLARAIDADASERTPVEGTIECDASPQQGLSYAFPYDGPVQLTLTPGADTTEAWVVARTTT